MINQEANSQPMRQYFVQLIAFIAVLVGAVVLAGWVTDITILKSISPSWVSMKVNTAVCFMMMGIAITFFTIDHQGKFNDIFKAIAWIASLLVLGVSSLTLLEYITNNNFGIDQFIISEALNTVGTSHPGRMAPETALCFFLLSTAKIFNHGIKQKTYWSLYSLLSGILVLILSLSSIQSYFTPQIGPYGWFGLTIMALHTSILFILLALATIEIESKRKIIVWTFNKYGTLAFFLGLLQISIIGLNTSRTQYSQLNLSQQIASTKIVSNQYGHLLDSILDAGSHARSHFLTKDEKYKKYLLTSKKDVFDELEKIPKFDEILKKQVNQYILWADQVSSAAGTANNQLLMQGELKEHNLNEAFNKIDKDLDLEQTKMQKLLSNEYSYSFILVIIGTIFCLIIFFALAIILNKSRNEQNTSQLELIAANTFNQKLVQAFPFPIDIVDLKGRILFASQKMQELIRQDESIVGKKCWDVYRDDKTQCSNCPLNKKFNIHEVTSLTSTDALKGKTFEIFHTSITFEGQPAVLEIFQDVTEKKQSEAILIQSDRLASMGMLVAGVAHEINNPLAYTMLNLEEAGEVFQELPTTPETRDAEERIKDALGGIERVAKIVQGLKIFSRAENTEFINVNLNQTLEVALNMAKSEIKYKAQIEKKFEDSLLVYGNEGQLAQVFLNLIINAAHAIQEGDVEHNTISIETSSDENDIFATVTDTGSGIDEKHLNKIFDPFFTTKAAGKGTGLGLAISNSIIKNHGGRIDVKSILGKGTTMTVVLPKFKSPLLPKSSESSTPILPIKLSGRFLIIDDESDIRSALVRLLEGCDTLEANSGEAAYDILKIDQNFDYILCDMMMPKMSGMDLYEILERELPALTKKMIFITGGAFTERAQLFLERVGDRKLDKPFTFESLRDLILSVKLKA